MNFPLILAISVIMSTLNFMLSRVEHEKKSFITSLPVDSVYRSFSLYLSICILSYLNFPILFRG